MLRCGKDVRCETQWLDWRRDLRDWSNELAYALRALRDSSESWAGSEGALLDDAALCMEKRLDCELEGVRAVLAVVIGECTCARTSDDRSGRVGVVPYGWALLKL
jgi:hypothetical protein